MPPNKRRKRVVKEVEENEEECEETGSDAQEDGAHEVQEDGAHEVQEDGAQEVQEVYDRFVARLFDAATAERFRLQRTSNAPKSGCVAGLGPVRVLDGIDDEQTGETTSPSSVVDVSRLESQKLGPRLKRNLLAARQHLGLDENSQQQCRRPEAMLSVLRSYKDALFYVPAEERRTDPAREQDVESHRWLYASHALAHVAATRNRILANNQRLFEARQKLVQEGARAAALPDDLVESSRDQGFTRPTVLIVVPFRKTARRLVHIMKQLIFGADSRATVLHWNRFEEEYGDARSGEPRQRASDEYKSLMSGNTDECFRLGLQFSKKSLRLYSKLERADMLICSALGARMLLDGNETGASEEGGGGGGGSTPALIHLFSSIQLLVIDRADIISMQNWEHIVLLCDQLNQSPKTFTTDIARIRTPYLDGHGRLFCQTVIFAPEPFDLATTLIKRSATSYRGGVIEKYSPEGCLSQVDVRLAQEMVRFEVSGVAEQSDVRFAQFRDKILPKLEQHTLLVIPSYFDFVRVRNHLKREQHSFVQLHEYAEAAKVERARKMFYLGYKKLLLITERFHFYHRRELKGVERVVFYQLPQTSHFYADFLNMGRPKDRENGRVACTVLYSRLDRTRLENVLGAAMARGLLQSPQSTQAILSEE